MKKINKNKVGILGYGEVGRALATLYAVPKIKDEKRNDKLKGVHILNICIPYSKNFVRIVKKEIKEIKPELTIIHSTVAPGTTKKIGGMIVHSPIRGVHPHLAKGIRTFVKYIGTDNATAGLIAENHFQDLKLKYMKFSPSIVTELGKLFSTTFYGLCIAYHGEMKKICDKEQISFTKVVTSFNRTYNEGYTELGIEDVVRPILYPPQNDKIGGHCVIPNVKILKKIMKSKALDLILEYEGKGRTT